MDMRRFNENRRQFPPEELEKYAGKYMAWNPDGTGIIADVADERDIDRAIRGAGFDPADVVVSFVPSPDEGFLGGGGEMA